MKRKKAKKYNYDQNPVLNFEDIILSDSVIVRISQKQFNDSIMVDVRKWIKFTGKEDYSPTLKGILLPFDTWSKDIWPVIQRFGNKAIDFEDK